MHTFDYIEVEAREVVVPGGPSGTEPNEMVLTEITEWC